MKLTATGNVIVIIDDALQDIREAGLSYDYERVEVEVSNLRKKLSSYGYIIHVLNNEGDL